jgi:hypothetical protein
MLDSLAVICRRVFRRKTEILMGRRRTCDAAFDPGDILTGDELAERLRVSKAWVYEATRARGRNGGKGLPCLHIGKYLRFSWTAVCKWLESNSTCNSPALSIADAPKKRVSG